MQLNPQRLNLLWVMRSRWPRSWSAWRVKSDGKRFYCDTVLDYFRSPISDDWLCIVLRYHELSRNIRFKQGVCSFYRNSYGKFYKLLQHDCNYLNSSVPWLVTFPSTDFASVRSTLDLSVLRHPFSTNFYMQELNIENKNIIEYIYIS